MYGLAHTDLAVGATLSSLAPLMSVPFALFYREERWSPPRFAAVTATVAGVIMLIVDDMISDRAYKRIPIDLFEAVFGFTAPAPPTATAPPPDRAPRSRDAPGVDEVREQRVEPRRSVRAARNDIELLDSYSAAPPFSTRRAAVGEQHAHRRAVTLGDEQPRRAAAASATSSPRRCAPARPAAKCFDELRRQQPRQRLAIARAARRLTVTLTA